jgi:hypothetical protein
MSMPMTAELHVARLRHEPVDHPVEYDIVIGPVRRQRRDPFHMQRCDVFQ